MTYDEYLAKHRTLNDEYLAKRKPLDDEYDAKVKPLDDEYYAKFKPLRDYAKVKPLGDEYLAKRKPLDNEYYAKVKPLRDEYEAKVKSLDERIRSEAQAATRRMSRLICLLRGHRPAEARFLVWHFTELTTLPTRDVVAVCPRCNRRLPGLPPQSAVIALLAREAAWHSEAAAWLAAK